MGNPSILQSLLLPFPVNAGAIMAHPDSSYFYTPTSHSTCWANHHLGYADLSRCQHFLYCWCTQRNCPCVPSRDILKQHYPVAHCSTTLLCYIALQQEANLDFNIHCEKGRFWHYVLRIRSLSFIIMHLFIQRRKEASSVQTQNVFQWKYLDFSRKRYK